MTDGRYSFKIGLDDKELQLNVEQAKKTFDSLVKAAREAGVKIDDSFKNPFENLTVPTNAAKNINGVAQSFNGLTMSTQQLVRELPAATMGLNTFFLAISNNLPIFADQIKAASAANRELVAQGQPIKSVFSQILSSLASWQTALVLGVSALAMYGKEIGNWIASLFKAKKAIGSTAEAQKTLLATIKKQGLGISDQIVEYKKLAEAYNKLGKDMDARKKFITDNKDAFHDLGVEVQNVAEADKLFIDQTDEFVEALQKRALAKAARKLAEQEYEKWLQKEQEYINQRDAGVSFGDRFVAAAAGIATPNAPITTSAMMTAEEAHEHRISALKEEADAALATADSYFELGEANEKLAIELMKKIGVTPSDPYTDYDAKALKDATRKLARDAAQARTDANIAEMREGLEREIAAINGNYDAKERAIADREKDMALMNKDGKLTAEQSAYFDTLYAANKQKREREILEAQKREADKIATMANTTRTLQLDAAQSEVDAMKEGEDKVLAEIALKYRKRREQLENGQRELMKSQKGVLTGKQAQMYGQMYENIDQEEANEIEEHNKKKLASLDDYLIKYGTIQEKILATTRKYEREIADAQSEGERMALAAERDTALAVYRAQVSDFAKGLVNLSIMEINKMIEDLTAQVEAKQAAFDALDTSDSQEAQDYQKTINELKAKIQLLQNESDSAQRSLKDNNWADAAQVVQNIASAASDAADSLEGVDDSLASTLRTISQFARGAVNLVSAIKVVVDAAGNAIDTALGIIGLVATAIQFIGTIINSVMAANKEYKETIENFNALNKELEQMRRLANINSLEGTIFGEVAFGNFVNNLNVMRDAAKAYEESMDAVANRAKAVGEVFGTKYGSQKLHNQLIESERHFSLYESLSQMSIQLSKRKTSTLGEQLPDLFAGGEVTLAGLQKLQQSDVWDKLSAENRSLIEQMIADWEAFEQATDAVNDYLKDIFGELGNEINDAIVDAFVNGTDAADAFGKSASDMLENLIKQIGQMAYIQPILDAAMERVKALNKDELTPEEYLQQLTTIMRDTMVAAEGSMGELNDFYKRMDNMAEGMGFDTFNQERSAQSRGIAQASQESIDELNGRATAIQSHTYSIMEGTKQLTRDSAQILRHLAGIESNTSRLQAVEQSLKRMEGNIDRIATRGVKMI